MYVLKGTMWACIAVQMSGFSIESFLYLTYDFACFVMEDREASLNAERKEQSKHG